MTLRKTKHHAFGRPCDRSALLSLCYLKLPLHLIKVIMVIWKTQAVIYWALARESIRSDEASTGSTGQTEKGRFTSTITDPLMTSSNDEARKGCFLFPYNPSTLAWDRTDPLTFQEGPFYYASFILKSQGRGGTVFMEVMSKGWAPERNPYRQLRKERQWGTRH